jgi:hypothetical protein
MQLLYVQVADSLLVGEAVRSLSFILASVLQIVSRVKT